MNLSNAGKDSPDEEVDTRVVALGLVKHGEEGEMALVAIPGVLRSRRSTVNASVTRVAMGGDKDYADGYDAIFGRKADGDSRDTGRPGFSSN